MLRTALVFFLIGQIVSIHTGITCEIMDQYHAIPLCSARTIWDARTGAEWTSERATYDAQAGGCRLRDVGGLITAQHGDGDAFKTHALDTWNAHADSLGSLLSAAMGLVRSREKSVAGCST